MTRIIRLFASWLPLADIYKIQINAFYRFAVLGLLEAARQPNAGWHFCLLQLRLWRNALIMDNAPQEFSIKCFVVFGAA
jgi:hypothetical protein